MSHDQTQFIEENLVAFTGMNRETVKLLLARRKYPTHAPEWEFWKPEKPDEISFFYYASRSYLFTNGTHVIPDALFNLVPSGCTVLDYGGGVGSSTFALVRKNCRILFYDISLLQTEFVKFCKQRHNLNIRIIDPVCSRPIPEIPENVDYALSLDVLEHLPDYPKHVSSIAKRINRGGSYCIYAPFRVHERDEPSHLKDESGLGNVMTSNGLRFEKSLGVVSIYRKG